MASITIRLADLDSTADRESVRRLTDEYSCEPVAQGKPLEAGVLGRLPDAMKEHGGVRVFLAFEGDEAVGIATCVLSFSTFYASPILNVHDLAVTPRHRGQGVGGKLLEAAEALAIQLGCSKVTLEVVPANDARRLYARAGFSETSLFCEKRL